MRIFTNNQLLAVGSIAIALQLSCGHKVDREPVASQTQVTAFMYFQLAGDYRRLRVWIEATDSLWVDWNSIRLTVIAGGRESDLSPGAPDAGCSLFMFVEGGENTQNGFNIPWPHGKDLPESAILTFSDDGHRSYKVPVQIGKADPSEPHTIVVPL